MAEAKKKRGGQPGNKNAVGNHGGAPCGNRNAAGHGAPYGNKNALKHGLYETILLPNTINLLAARIMERKGMEPTLKNFYDTRAQLIAETCPDMAPFYRKPG